MNALARVLLRWHRIRMHAYKLVLFSSHLSPRDLTGKSHGRTSTGLVVESEGVAGLVGARTR